MYRCGVVLAVVVWWVVLAVVVWWVVLGVLVVLAVVVLGVSRYVCTWMLA